MPAPRKKTVEREDSRPGLPDLVRRLANDGIQWADAEFSLARAETSLLLRHIAIGLGVAVVALPVMAAAIVILAQAAVAALAPFLRGPELAGLAVGFGLSICAILLGLVARHFLFLHKAELSSPILRWVKGAAPRNGAAT